MINHQERASPGEDISLDGCYTSCMKNENINTPALKVVNGGRKDLENELVELLFVGEESDAEKEQFQNLMKRLEPQGKLTLLHCDPAQDVPEFPHQ